MCWKWICFAHSSIVALFINILLIVQTLNKCKVLQDLVLDCFVPMEFGEGPNYITHTYQRFLKPRFFLEKKNAHQAGFNNFGLAGHTSMASSHCNHIETILCVPYQIGINHHITSRECIFIFRYASNNFFALSLYRCFCPSLLLFVLLF